MAHMRLFLAALLAMLLVPTALASARPQVRVMAFAPARIAGTGFKPRERVVVTVTGTSTHLKKTVLVGAGGAFVARFTAGAGAAGCRQIAVLAVGASGDRASWKSPQKPCGPPPAP